MKKRWNLAFFSAVILGLLVHIYKFTNFLPTEDSMFNFYSSQNMLGSGRWFLSASCCLSSFFDLPWMVGLISLIFMGVTAAIVAEIFEMDNPVLIVLSSGLQVAFPAMTGTFAYEFTADGYMIAMSMAALAACLTKMDVMGKGFWKRSVVSALLICFACGIYQAYVSFAFALSACYFMTELLENRYSIKKYWQWIGIHVLIYVGAMAAYYAIWKLCMYVQGFQAVAYYGIDRAGMLSSSDLINGIVKSIRAFIFFFLEWDIFYYGVTVYSVLNILFLISLGAGLLAAAWKTGCLKQPGRLVLLVLSCIAFPFGCYIWNLTSPDVVYLARMLQSLCILYVFSAVVFDRWIRPVFSNFVLVVLIAVVFNNAVAANLYYNYMELCVERTRAAAVEVSTRIHMLDDGTVKYIAFYGGLDDWTGEEEFSPSGLRNLGGWKLVHKTILQPVFMQQYLDFDLSYYRENNLEFPEWDRTDLPVPQGWYFRLPVMNPAEEQALGQTDEVKAMPIWPAADSVKRIGDTVVVKFSEVEDPVF